MFYVAAIFIFFWGVVVFLFLKSKPVQVGLMTEDDIDKEELDTDLTTQPFLEEEDRPIGFIEAWFIPGVALYSFSYAFLKFVNYAFFFWLPFYLSEGK